MATLAKDGRARHTEVMMPSSSNDSLPLTVAEMAALAGGLAHELRNPLSTMMVNLKLLAEDLGDPNAHPDDVRRRGLQRVDVLRREAERLQNLFDDFLRTTGPYRLQRRAIDLHRLTARVAEFFEPLARDHGVEMVLKPDGEPLSCEVDENLLNQAVLNLVINAQEAMPQGGRLTLATGRRGGQAVISISDTGVGIAPAQREHVLRPFFSTKGGGTGLGLSVTRRIVHEHGGEMSFDSEPGKGSTFTIRLPLKPGASRTMDAPS